MRTIKFRGKARKTGEWFYGNLYVEDSFGCTHICTYERGCLDVDPDTVGQFTGLYDCDGKEIYEGDILDFNGLTVEVRFVRGAFAFLANGYLDDELYGDCRTDLFAKVIGNIHDNPELLKGGEK